ncbi:MAG: PAS domain-containing protein, partial [Cyclobacteriaceae bacterium]|nr:PAS domain-containing protein [Cyclobacteriaceae bacterium]
EEAIGQNPRILKTDYHKNKIYQKLWNTITNGKTWRGEFLNKKKNGDLYWEKGTITPVKNDQGDIINYIAIKEDITELKRSQEELIQASEIWQNIQTGLYIYHMEDLNDDASLRMIAANPASEILTGIRTRDVIGKTLDENFPGLREKGIPQKYAEVVRTKNNIRFEDLVYGDDRVIQGAFSVEAFSLPENKVGVSFENISERKQAEGKLRKSEQKLSIHIEETPVGVIEWNIDFEVTSWNKAAENIFGYSKEEAIGSYTVGLIVPESAREKIDVVWDALINQTGGKRSINENITKEGKTILCDWYNTALVDEEGNTIGVASIVQDITIQKRIEKDLKDSEEKHKLISKISSDYVYSIQPDRNGKYMIKWVSGAFKRITGYTVEEINSMDNQLKSIIHPEDLKRLDQKHINLSKLKLSATDEYRIITKSGRVKWLSDSYVQLHGPESKKIQMIHGSVKDITYKKLSEEVLKDSEHLLRESQKVAKMGSYVMDITSGIWQSSAILNKMFGIGKRYNTDVSGWLQIVHPEDRAMMQDYFVTNVLKNKEPFNKEYRIKRINDQQEYWMHGMGKLEFDDDGNPIKMIGTIQDITDRKQAEEELGKQHYYLEKAEEIGKTGTWELDLIENKLFWSNQNYSIFGIPIGTPLTYELFVDCVHPDDREYVNAQWLASLDGKPYDIEHRLLIDGEVKWVSEKAELIFDENNKALRAIGFTQD